MATATKIDHELVRQMRSQEFGDARDLVKDAELGRSIEGSLSATFTEALEPELRYIEVSGDALARALQYGVRS